MVRKAMVMLMAMAMLVSFCLMSGCGIKVQLITLREAYEAKYITLDDVESIAEANKFGGEYDPEATNKEVAKIGPKVREAAAERLRDMETSYVVKETAEDIFIFECLGKYHNCYAFILLLKDRGSMFEPPRVYEIDGVEISVIDLALFDDIMIYR